MARGLSGEIVEEGVSARFGENDVLAAAFHPSLADRLRAGFGRRLDRPVYCSPCVITALRHYADDMTVAARAGDR